MKTRIILLAQNEWGEKGGAFAHKKMKIAAQIIRKGGLVAFPTETVYGLGANALNPRAVRRIFRAKGRPFDDPLIVHIESERQLYSLTAHVPIEAKLLIDRFWPGPLTLVLRKTKKVPRITTGGLETVAIRMPSHPVALGLICTAGVPIAAPSANTFGRPSPTSARDVLEDLDGKIDCVIDSGRTRIGIESTVLDLSWKTPMLLRPGKVTLEQLQKTIGKIKVHPLARRQSPNGNKKQPFSFSWEEKQKAPCPFWDEASSTKWTMWPKRKRTAHAYTFDYDKKKASRSPGLAYRHYAPRAEVILVEGSAGRAEAKIKKIKKGLAGKKVVVLRTSGISKEKLAARLFSDFRDADRKGVDFIVVQGVDEKGLGLAVMNRARKAAARVVKV